MQIKLNCAGLSLNNYLLLSAEVINIVKLNTRVQRCLHITAVFSSKHFVIALVGGKYDLKSEILAHLVRSADFGSISFHSLMSLCGLPLIFSKFQ